MCAAIFISKHLFLKKYGYKYNRWLKDQLLIEGRASHFDNENKWIMIEYGHWPFCVQNLKETNLFLIRQKMGRQIRGGSSIFNWGGGGGGN